MIRGNDVCGEFGYGTVHPFLFFFFCPQTRGFGSHTERHARSTSYSNSSLSYPGTAVVK